MIFDTGFRDLDYGVWMRGCDKWFKLIASNYELQVWWTTNTVEPFQR